MNISISSLKKSPKNEGLYEHILIDKLFKHFIDLNYIVKKHVTFNIAWGSVLSEIDLILLKNNELTIVEVKSKKDKIIKAKKQIKKFMKFVDYIYIASNTLLKKSEYEDNIGIIYVKKDISMIRKASKISYIIKESDLLSLKKICLLKLLNSDLNYKYKNKNDIVKLICSKYDQCQIKELYRKVILCNVDCGSCIIKLT